MASDTATLDLERVHEQKRRLEAERDGRTPAEHSPLGPEDRAPHDELHIDTDPAVRAAQIVQEVLAAAERRREGGPPPEPAPAEGTAAARARRIVEEVLAAAADAGDAETVTARSATDEDTDADAAWTPREARADLVLLTVSDPLVLVPGETFEPDADAYVPARRQSGLSALVDDAVGSVVIEAPAEPDELVTPTSISEAIRGAGESSNRHGVRWIVAGAVWALAFALVGPFAYKAVISSADLTIDLWDEETAIAEQQVEVPEDELPPADEGSAESQPAS